MNLSVQEKILRAATRRFVRDGILATRIEDIRREAKVSVGAVYHHFPDKEALYAEAFVRALGDYQAGFLEALHADDDAESGVKAVVRYHLGWVAANQESAALLLGERPTSAEVMRRLADQNRAFFGTVLRWWRTHAAYGTLRELDPTTLYSLWLGPAQEYTRHWLSGRGSKLPGVAADPGSVADQLGSAAWLVLKAARGE